MQDLFKFDLQLFAEGEDHGETADPADPQFDDVADDEEFGDVKLDIEIQPQADDEDSEGEPGDDESPEAENPDQPERKSKQPPEVDAAFAEARRSKEKADQLERELQQYREKEAETQAKQQEQAVDPPQADASADAAVT